jgi:hypothetical protein
MTPSTASATGPSAGEPRQRRGESGCRTAAASGRLPPPPPALARVSPASGGANRAAAQRQRAAAYHLRHRPWRG